MTIVVVMIKEMNVVNSRLFLQRMILLVLYGFNAIDVSSQQFKSTSSKNLQTEMINTVAERRNFASFVNGIAVSPLVTESHHEVVPVQTSSIPIQSHGPHHPITGDLERLATSVHANPVLAALLISSLLGTTGVRRPVIQSYNSPEHEPPNPYVALLLSNYGRYIPKAGISGHGLYGYNAVNNIHNNKPFGSYKIYEDYT